MFPFLSSVENSSTLFWGGKKRDEVEYGLADGFVRLGDYA